MSIINCSCNGINPLCNKCDGKGYYDSNSVDYIPIKKSKFELNKPFEKTFDRFSEIVKLTSINEIQIFISKIISKIDFLSNIQTNILKSLSEKISIPNAKVNQKIDSVLSIEKDKKLLKEKLRLAIDHSKQFKFSIKIKYHNVLSYEELENFKKEDFILLKRKLIKIDEIKGKR